MTIRGELDVYQVNLQRITDVLRLQIEALHQQHEALLRRIERLEDRLANRPRTVSDDASTND